VFGDHFRFSDGKAVICSAGTRSGTGFESDQGYALTQKRLKVNAAGSELEIVAGVVFGQGVVTVRAAQATLNASWGWIAACRGSLCESQRDQQSRYNDQQACSLHEILRRFSPCGGLKFRLGFDSASNSHVEPLRIAGSSLRTWGIQVKHDNLMPAESERLSQTAHI
jgi:hypothetical protein